MSALKEQTPTINEVPSRYKLIGAIATCIWLGILLIIFIPRYSDFLCLPLNEMGDFFAGAFAPIAFLWLVLGYFQQSQELQQNTTALKMQLSELKQQVENTEKLAQHAGTQASEAKKNTDSNLLQSWHSNYISLIDKGPKINFEDYVIINDSYVFTFKLYGIQALEIVVSSYSGEVESPTFPSWSIDVKKDIVITPSDRYDLLISFTINYKTPFGLTGEVSYTFNRTTSAMHYDGILLVDPPKPIL
ncbi:MAG: hypothetical protein Q7T48_08250 [Cellvibrio sp.]|uniref:hypothetical protein n=1 Tax=Cellvibrio sp. TaxID=1965322 RepID=UPI00271FB11F|nr:hypothetical protein [Cellvibrio sp.]